MRVYKHWAKIQQNIKPFDGSEGFEITCYGGSNQSMAEAVDRAHAKAKLVAEKIKGNHQAIENYEVEIREELIKEIDDHNVITRNRYGALVWNSEDICILDVDQPKLGFFDNFKKWTPKELKLKMFNQIQKTALNKKFRTLCFRIYETKKGYRIIIANQALHTEQPLVDELFEKFNVDPLYAKLCKKQKCFRARLTPKPSYMKHKGFRVPFPRNAEEDAAFDQWLSSYEDKANSYSTCRLILSIGPKSSGNRVIETHDFHCGVQYKNPLA